MPIQKCDSLECFSTAVAKSKTSGQLFCCQCALKIAGQFGPESVESLPGAKFPWDHPPDRTCKHCGTKINLYITYLTGDCPSCKKRIEGIEHVYRM